MSGKYILIKQKPVLCEDLFEWGEWMQEGVRHVGDKTTKGVRISTVFLGLDHNYGDSKPILFESLIFGGDCDGYMCRYTTMNKAREGHRNLVKYIRKITKCSIKKKHRKNLSLNLASNRTTAIRATLAIAAQQCSSPDHKPTIPIFAAPVISELLKPSNPINGKIANDI